MVEIAVWLLISMGNNGASHTVSQHKTKDACEAVHSQLFTRSTSKCIQAVVYN